MKQLVELGALELIEMGKVGEETASGPSPVADVIQFVRFMENPYAGMLEEGDTLDPRQKAIAQRLKTLSILQRKALVRPEILKGLGYTNILAEMAGLARRLNDLDNEIFLGKSLKSRLKGAGKRIKAVGKKVAKVVKSPAFLSVAALAANFIPVVGQIASAGLATAAGIRAKKDQEKKMEKEEKKAIRQAVAVQQEEQGQQLDAYYAQYQTYFVAKGYTPDVWSGLTNDQKYETATALSEGKLESYGSASGQNDELARSAALSVAMQNVYGSQLPGQGVDVASLPPEVQAQAYALAPEYERQIQAVGKDDFLAASQKAVGQGAAVTEFFRGAGADLPGGLGDLFAKFGDDDARKAGEQDLKNSAAGVGALDVTDDLMKKGSPSEIPWLWIGLGAAGLGVGFGAYALATSGSGRR